MPPDEDTALDEDTDVLDAELEADDTLALDDAELDDATVGRTVGTTVGAADDDEAGADVGATVGRTVGATVGCTALVVVAL